MLYPPPSFVVIKRETEILRIIARYGWEYVYKKLSNSNSLQGEADTPSLPLPDVLCQILIELGPTYVKLGQLLSTRPDLLPLEYIEALESLHSNVPSLPWLDVKHQLEADLGCPVTEKFAEIEEVSIAAGSLGQVHKAKLLNGDIVAVKIQRPGIRQVIIEDLQVLQFLVDRFSKGKLGEAYDLKALLEEFSLSILNELNFKQEEQNTIAMGKNLVQSQFWPKNTIQVPKVYPDFTRERLLVLEWIEGTSLFKANISPERKIEIARLISQMVMQQFFIDGFFHADPHPGNFFYLGDEQGYHLTLLDCGMVSRLDPRTKNILLELFVGIVEADPRQTALAVYNLGFAQQTVNLKTIEDQCDRLLRSNYSRSLADLNFARLINEVLEIPRTNHLQLPGSVGLLVKAFTNAEGVARTLDPDFPFIEVARPVIEKAVRRQLLGKYGLQEKTYLTLKTLESLSVLPQRLENIFDRLEGSELSINWSWRGQEDFQKMFNKGIRRLSLALLAIGGIGSGALLIATNSNAGYTFDFGTILWGNGLLIGGLALAICLVFELIFKP